MSRFKLLLTAEDMVGFFTNGAYIVRGGFRPGEAGNTKLESIIYDKPSLMYALIFESDVLGASNYGLSVEDMPEVRPTVQRLTPSITVQAHLGEWDEMQTFVSRPGVAKEDVKE